MDNLPSGVAGPLADAVLALHVGVVAFVVLGQLAVLAGGWLQWEWVRNPWFRATHLLLMLFVAGQAWLGALCPLTVWEQDLRAIAGEATHGGSFVEYWLSRLIFFRAPWWAFVAAYTAFAALVLASWWWVPPRRMRRH
jgi:hypothetical protein